MIRILFFEKYARISTYSIFSYVNKNKIRYYVFEMATTSNYKHRNNILWLADFNIMLDIHA